MYILSFYDVTGNAVRPWAAAGYRCYCFDIQNKGTVETFPIWRESTRGCIHYRNADLYSAQTWIDLENEFTPDDVALVLGFPVCTDLAVSGAKHWEKKRAANPDFQIVAADHARRVAEFACHKDAPFAIENPVGALSTLWRKPNFYFHPYEYGGYLRPDEAQHPEYPDHIAPRDAYFKKTGIWCGNGFCKPQERRVDPIPRDRFGMSSQFAKLGGKSAKTKNIRSATPRGFARAVFTANNGD